MGAPEPRWTSAEATALRATAFIHLLVMSAALVTPRSLLGAWGLPFEEPATWMRFAMVTYGALGVALLRAVRLPRRDGRLLVETVGLIKLAFVLVVAADVLARRLPGAAWLSVLLDLIFGVALFRAARRPAPKPDAPR